MTLALAWTGALGTPLAMLAVALINAHARSDRENFAAHDERIGAVESAVNGALAGDEPGQGPQQQPG